jgi:S1-C subfamily serine protease
MTALPDSIDAIRPAIVQILLGWDGGRPAAVGTGFIVDRAGFVLTARHVARDARSFASAQGLPNPRLLVGLAQPNTENMRANFTLVTGEVIEDDQRH